MSSVVAQILEQTDSLSAAERAELADQLMARLALDESTDAAEAQLSEVQRRIDEAEAGKVALIPGDEAMQLVRRIVAAAHRKVD